MKKRIFCIIMAATLLSGCGGAPQSGNTSEKPELTTAMSTTATTTAATTPATTASQELPLYTQQTSQGSLVGGVSLSNEHEELRSVFKGADGYCDFEDMGLQLMHCRDIEKKALLLLMELQSFDPCYEEKRMGGFAAADDGCVYFSLTFAHAPTQSDGYDYGWKWTDYYFCCDCATGDVTQVLLPEGYTELVDISADIMVAENDGEYAVIHRKSGFVQPLPDIARNIVVCDNVVFFQYPSPDDGRSGLWFTTGWYTVDEHHAVEGSTDAYDQRAVIFEVLGDIYDVIGDVSYDEMSDFYYENPDVFYYVEHTLRRGVNRILGYSSRYDGITTMMGTSFLTNDPRRRVRDMVYDTYYAGTVMIEKNLLGYRSRFSIIDDNGEDHILGTMQTDNDNTYSSDFHATKNGVIYLNTENETFILLGEEKSNGRIDCSKGIVAAFAPDQLDRRFDYVFCDDEYLYFFNPEPAVVYALRRTE